MTRLNNYLRIIGLIGLLLGLTLFLSGCFDLYQEVWIASDPEESRMKGTITTTSEEIYDLLKDMTSSEYEEDELEFRIVEPDSPEGEKKFEIIVESQLEEGMLEVFPQTGSFVAYQVELLGEEDEDGDEMDEIARSLFEEHSFEFFLSTPKPIIDAWWGRYDVEERRRVDSGLIQGTTFSVELALEEAMTPDYGYVTVVTER